MIKGSAIQDRTITGSKLCLGAVSKLHLSEDIRKLLSTLEQSEFKDSGYEPGELVFRDNVDITLFREIAGEVKLKDSSPHIDTDKSCYVLYKNISDNPVNICLFDSDNDLFIFNQEEYKVNPGKYCQLTAKSFGKIRYISIS